MLSLFGRFPLSRSPSPALPGACLPSFGFAGRTCFPWGRQQCQQHYARPRISPWCQGRLAAPCLLYQGCADLGLRQVKSVPHPGICLQPKASRDAHGRGGKKGWVLSCPCITCQHLAVPSRGPCASSHPTPALCGPLQEHIPLPANTGGPFQKHESKLFLS